jgi:hypothetical protein
MVMPVVIETVPDSIRAQQPDVIAHIVQRDRVRASILALPREPSSREAATGRSAARPS